MTRQRRFIVIPNWDDFQHYKKDRTPPWIKVHNKMLDDYEFTTQLTDAQRYHLVGLWLLASRTKNRIPFDTAWIAKHVSATSPIDLSVFVDLGFIEIVDELGQQVHEGRTEDLLAGAEQDASTSIARRSGDGSLSREEENRSDESRGEEMGAPAAALDESRPAVSLARGGTSSPDGPPYLHRLPDGWKPSTTVLQGIEARLIPSEFIEERVTAFCLHYAEKGLTNGHAEPPSWGKLCHDFVLRDWGRDRTEWTRARAGGAPQGAGAAAALQDVGDTSWMR